MATDPAELSVEEIRKHFVECGRPVSPQLLRQLRSDARLGVRRLAEQIERRRGRERGERLRMEAMLRFEKVLWSSGLTRVAGVDEVGMGPLAGPVIAAAAVFPPGSWIEGVDDSKRLEPDVRERLAEEIRAEAAIGIGRAEPGEIDERNVYRAGLLAMRRALDALPEPPEHVLVDARAIPDLPVPQNAFEKGDGLSFSIAAASIVAKVHRDRLMRELDAEYPQYGFAAHKGYCTAEHQEAIRRHGPCPVHRMSYGVLRELQGECSELFYRLRERIQASLTAEECARLDLELDGARAELPEIELRKLRTLLSRRWKAV